MQRIFAMGVFVILSWVFPQAISALTRTDGSIQLPPLWAQSQTFVSSTTSLVRQGAKSACVQSAGTDWKGTSVATQVGSGQDANLQGLTSNTPYVSLIRPVDKDMSLRLALGFRITQGSPRFETAGTQLRDIQYQIEPRGDALVVTDPASLAQLRAALRSPGGLQLSAQSKKMVPLLAEHVVMHTYKLANDPIGLDDCRNLAKKPAPEHLGHLQIGLAAMARDDVDMSQSKAMACNRDIDPTGAELVAIGALDGLWSPLSHALIKRNADGVIEAIWAGDLLRIERIAGAYQSRVSNSVRAQGAMDSQTVAACTRMSAPICVTVSENDQGRISVAQCLPDLIAFAASPGFSSLPAEPAAPISQVFSGGGGSIGGGGGFGSAVSTSGLDVFDDEAGFEELFVLATSDPQRDGTILDDPTPISGNPNASTDPAVVPVPASVGLLIFAIGLVVCAGNRGRLPKMHEQA